MKKMLLTTVSLSLLVFSVPVVADDSYTATCEELGYKTNLSDCTVGLPLLCPVSGNTEGNKLKCLCMTESCRGYSLTETDLDETASDGRAVREHIEELESCDSGVDADKVTYYRIKKCKDGSLYQVQNDKPTCDVGCPRSRYPYSEHPGDLAGEVEKCIDEKGVWFGYLSCNAGWVASGEAGHECAFNECELKNYPYTHNPNEIQQRGKTTNCKVGGNNYYQYTECDSGYTLKGSICQAKCQLQNCTINSSAKGYNEWSCAVKDKMSCQVGDAAYIGNSYLGVIAYQPDGEGETLIIATEENDGIKPFESLHFTNLKAQFIIIANGSGKNNTLSLYQKCISNVDYQCPVIENCMTYSSPMCSNVFCRSGEWFLPNRDDVKKTYTHRNILYNAVSNNLFISKTVWTSDFNALNWQYTFRYSDGYLYDYDRTVYYPYFPVLSYTQR